MIQLPRRSVTRFFIPLIDVLTLMFCIFLLMPLVKATGEDEEGEDRGQQGSKVSADNARPQLDIDRLQKENRELRRELQKLLQDKIEAIPQQLFVRVLEIGDDGRLFFYDAGRDKDRRLEITRQTVREFVELQKLAAGKRELYFLVLYPRPASGSPSFPLRSQREEYDRWFNGIAHSYDAR